MLPTHRANVTRGTICLSALACLGLLAAPSLSPGMTGTFTNVADLSTNAPGQNGTFTGFGDTPSVSGSTVAFYGFYSAGTGIYTGTVGATGTSRVADRYTAVPGRIDGFTDFGLNANISGSTVTFLGAYLGGQGIYTGTAGATGAGRVVDFSTTAPGQSGTFTGFGLKPAVSGSTVAFRGNYSGGQAIYTGTAGSLTLTAVADRTTTAPGRGGAFTGFENPAISGNNVVFQGYYAGGSGIYSGLAGARGASLVADPSSIAPGHGTNFINFGVPSVSGGTAAFYGTFTGGSGIYTGAVGTAGANLVADNFTAVPGRTGNFSYFGTLPAISGSNVAFIGSYAGGSGLFLELGDSLIDVIDTGDPLFGSTVSSLNFGSSGLDGTTLAFNYTLASGASGEAVVSVVPEPSTRAMLLSAGVGLLGLSFRGCRRRARRA